MTKTANFQNPRWRTAAFWKSLNHHISVKLLLDFDKIWWLQHILNLMRFSKALSLYLRCGKDKRVKNSKSRVCTVVQYAGYQSVWKNGKFDLPRKYKIDKDIQTLPRIYDYVTELSCCAESEQNWLTQFCWGNRGSLSFFTHTHTISQSNKFFHLAYRSQIWKDLKRLWLKTRGFTPRCAFWGIVDDKSCLGVQISKKNIFGDHSMQNLL